MSLNSQLSLLLDCILGRLSEMCLVRFDTAVRCAKLAAPIMMPFGTWTLAQAWNGVLGRGPKSAPGNGAIWGTPLKSWPFVRILCVVVRSDVVLLVQAVWTR